MISSIQLYVETNRTLIYVEQNFIDKACTLAIGNLMLTLLNSFFDECYEMSDDPK